MSCPYYNHIERYFGGTLASTGKEKFTHCFFCYDLQTSYFSTFVKFCIVFCIEFSTACVDVINEQRPGDLSSEGRAGSSGIWPASLAFA
jgi:hypothetical protein